MIKFLFLVLFLSSSWASVDLKVGDVLLQPLDCGSCDLIEAEEETIFSHVGLVLSVGPEIQVAEAYGKVKRLPLKTFMNRTEKGQRILVIRFKDQDLVEDLQLNAHEFEDYFARFFEGKKYDAAFLWDDETLYCSELVSKLFQAFLRVEGLPLKRMHFVQNREAWFKYFRGKIPDGEWGNSPGDYERSDLFEKIGEL